MAKNLGYYALSFVILRVSDSTTKTS